MCIDLWYHMLYLTSIITINTNIHSSVNPHSQYGMDLILGIGFYWGGPAITDAMLAFLCQWENDEW